jgi:hypothetical protein
MHEGFTSENVEVLLGGTIVTLKFGFKPAKMKMEVIYERTI